MELMTHRHLSPNPILCPPSSASSFLPNGSNSALFSPGHGKLKSPTSHPAHHLFLIRAVLAERPPIAAPGEAQCSQPTLLAAGEASSSTSEVAAAARPAAASARSAPLKLGRKGVENGMGMVDTELGSTWAHRAWVATGSMAMVGMMGKAVEAIGTAGEAAGVAAGAAVAYLVADLATGIYHWGVDNYGDAETAIFGPQIDAFQGHHKRPWTITKRQFANNIHALARPATFALAPFLLLPSHAYVDSFLAAFLACVVYSQQFHAWAHAKKKDIPGLVSTLQDAGLLVSRKMHGAHHRPPYNTNYCIVSGLWNPLLDRTRFFTKLEKLIFSVWRIRPRSWAETSLDWLQDGSYFSDGTDLDDTLSHP